MTIKIKVSHVTPHGNIDMVYCNYCGEGVSARLEDADAVKAFKKEHKSCKKPKNTVIDLGTLPDAPL